MFDFFRNNDSDPIICVFVCSLFPSFSPRLHHSNCFNLIRSLRELSKHVCLTSAWCNGTPNSYPNGNAKKKKIPFSLSIPFIHVLSMRSRMILCSVSEELFWSNYFAHVELLLQANETPSTSIAVSTVSVQPSTSLGTKNSTNLGSTSNAETSKHVNILSDTLSTNLVPASTSPIDTKTAIENLSLSANAFLAPDSTYLQVRPFCFSSNCIIILIIFS
jgi:hypothetical protein